MIRGLYSAASGMIAEQAIQDTLAYNIANANTVGFKQDTQTFRALHGMEISRLTNGSGRGPVIGELGVGVAADKVYTDWQTGPLARTGNPLDASLGDNQLFAVQTPRGERYTRAGEFQVDATGRLLTNTGLAVLDSNRQPIQAQGPGKFALDSAGNLTSNGQIVARLRIVQADPNTLIKDGDSLFAALDPAGVRPAPAPLVRPGTLEQSNVNPVGELVKLITVSRSFDTAQRALTTQDELLRQAATEVGKT
ncbi:MAG TPA: flagellar hook-basal body protein [Chthonomonadaceae bacterium]|nr:flagellar hook-basal body protein [Chthonomonadaceae bacterium]